MESAFRQTLIDSLALAVALQVSFTDSIVLTAADHAYIGGS